MQSFFTSRGVIAGTLEGAGQFGRGDFPAIYSDSKSRVALDIGAL